MSSREAVQKLWLPFAEAYLRQNGVNFTSTESEAADLVWDAAREFQDCLGMFTTDDIGPYYLVEVYFYPKDYPAVV